MVQLLRSLMHLVAVLTISFWALTAWPLPLGLLTGAVAFVLTVVIWALFLSPRPVLHTDRFGQSLIELLLIGGAAAAMLALGSNWMLVAGYFVLSALFGYLAGREA